MRPRIDDRRARRPLKRPAVEGLEVRLVLSGEATFPFAPAPAEPGSSLLFFGPELEDLPWSTPSWGEDPIDLGTPPPPATDQLPTLPVPGDSNGGAVPIDPPAAEAPGGSTQPEAPPPQGTTPDPGPVVLPPDDPRVEPLPVPTPDGATPAPSPTIVLVEPGRGAEVAFGSIDGITLTFATPLSSKGVSPRDFRLERVGGDGRAEAIFDRATPPSLRFVDDGSRLLLIPPRALEPGLYRLTLSGDARFVAAGGGLFDANGKETILAEFRIASAPVPVPAPAESPKAPVVPSEGRPSPVIPASPAAPAPAAPIGVTLDRSRSLGTIGPEILRVAGTLDLATDPGAVRLYRIDLAPGHLWRLGLEISAGRDGSPLLANLALFDAEGRLIDTGAVGRLDAPSDPFLFAGLEPGTYYVGVSSSANDPWAGGYDPATGASSANLPAGKGGAFTLSLVADVADVAPRLVDLVVDRADPADPVPTGLTFRFDGPLRIETPGVLDPAAAAKRLFLVVDQDGRAWPNLAVKFDETSGSLSILFNDRLPTGRYEVRLPASGSLVDLIGRAPVAEGMPEGVLGRFEITTEPTARAPHDLGALLPGRASAGVAFGARLGPGESATFRVVATFWAQYTLKSADPEARLSIELIGPEGLSDFGRTPSATNGVVITLHPGTYLIRVKNTGTVGVDAALSLRSLGVQFDSVPLNGVGQGPALGMRMYAPPAGHALGALAPEEGPMPADPVASAPASSPMAPTTEPKVEAALPVALAPFQPVDGSDTPAGPVLTIDTAPIGYPTAQALRIVGISPGSGGVAATASDADGAELFRMVAIGEGAATVDRLRDEAGSIVTSSAGPSALISAEVVPVETNSRRGDAPPEPTGLAPTELVDAVLALLDAPLPTAEIGEDTAGDPEVLLAGTGVPAEVEEESARLPVPLVQLLGVGMVVSWSAREWKRRRSRAVQGPISDGAGGPGPRPDDAGRPAGDGDAIRPRPRAVRGRAQVAVTGVR